MHLSYLGPVSYERENCDEEVSTRGPSQVALVTKNPPANAGDISDARRYSGGGLDNLLQCSCLENPMDRGARGGLQFIGLQRV